MLNEIEKSDKKIRQERFFAFLNKKRDVTRGNVSFRWNHRQKKVHAMRVSVRDKATCVCVCVFACVRVRGGHEHLPDVSRVAAHQLDDAARVADRAVRQQEEQPRVAGAQGLPQRPVERRQQVGAAHVRPHPADVVARLGQRVLAQFIQSYIIWKWI